MRPRPDLLLLALLGGGLVVADMRLGLRLTGDLAVDEIDLIDGNQVARLDGFVIRVHRDGDSDRLKLERDGVPVLDVHHTSMDDTFRTHVAWCGDGTRRLCVFDPLSRPKASVHEWDGDRFLPVAADARNERVLDALAARDDGGTRYQWFAFALLCPVGSGLYLLLAALQLRRQQLPPIPVAVARA